MNIILPILLYQLVFLGGVWSIDSDEDTSKKKSSGVHHHHASLPLSRVKIYLESKRKVIPPTHVDLELTERSLANENLPVWITSGVVDEDDLLNKNNDDLQRNYEVMKHLGKFSTYHQHKTSSAAVYFHKRREFDGMINVRVIIQGLSVKSINSDGSTRSWLGHNGFHENKEHIGHSFTDLMIGPGRRSGVNEANKRLRTYKDHIFDGYPEILVIVDWELAELWVAKMLRLNYKWDYKQTSSRQKLQGLDFYSAVVAHVITLFNGVDMLYSKLKNTKIQINIAGIVIGSEQNSFDFLKKCFVKPAHGEIAMDAQCAMTEFDFYIKARERLIPTGSYDFIVFLTNNDIVKVSKNVFTKRTSYTSVGGLATIHDDFYEKILKRGTNVKPIAIIGEKGYFDIFRNVAHEIGHPMTLLHDEPPYLTEDIKCCGYIMKPKSSECEHCLSWSSTSEETLRLFFSSPNCCALINKPRSLLPPGRYEMLTPDEQCQCYGYKSAKKSSNDYCTSHLKCKISLWKTSETVIPMDGTPCDEKKVCWNKKCKHIQVFNDADSNN